jgi:hypothetical protein
MAELPESSKIAGTIANQLQQWAATLADPDKFKEEQVDKFVDQIGDYQSEFARAYANQIGKLISDEVTVLRNSFFSNLRPEARPTTFLYISLILLVAYLLFMAVSAKQTQAPVSPPPKPGNPGGGHETK